MWKHARFSKGVAPEMAHQHLFLNLLAKARPTGTESRHRIRLTSPRRGYARSKNAGRVNREATVATNLSQTDMMIQKRTNSKIILQQ